MKASILTGNKKIIYDEFWQRQKFKDKFASHDLHLQILKFSQESIIKESFKNLPFDEYIEVKNRQRRFSHFHILSEKIVLLPHKHFNQSSQHNCLFGDIDRNYLPLEYKVAYSFDLQYLINHFIKKFNHDNKPIEVGIHQIRIICSPLMLGNPVPEGIHQDGYKYVGIYCVERTNILGGATSLYKDKNSQPFVNITLNPNEFFIFNDKEYFHFTSAIQPEISAQGYRDVFIFTANYD